eukprot:UN26178
MIVNFMGAYVFCLWESIFPSKNYRFDTDKDIKYEAGGSYGDVYLVKYDSNKYGTKPHSEFAVKFLHSKSKKFHNFKLKDNLPLKLVQNCPFAGYVDTSVAVTKFAKRVGNHKRGNSTRTNRN